ncbi:hypothetical protein FNF27_04301 [Cafeteria roenbergensis]|uniref:50S ribosomal protein L9, chloroplastic n=1 Tax=Cafeteria roenbergensis TaxID=33653 RepID=A0A5A8E9S1_CAFRO|nr:hypothetical protein FNF29_02732 [Cafeteria roenbergensis]KAA0161221.1 hypothetical protein FNF28_05100 [Cafeteria roenbergensis]KAA0166849.1 hypothetical protein FNF31_01224 [Cafeteria roenbergensis]KAA0174289.1 hypothetical protein FNF27_04301 [Cafeteria roenbergensis]|eukprot:KAA0154109.1 hypothetical protein FNF29_02732 [Cafeteria roenbergensis]
MAAAMLARGASVASRACAGAPLRVCAPAASQRRWRSVGVILLEHIDELGFQGQEVEVKSGFARNYLIPQKLAAYASDSTREAFKADLTADEEAAAGRARERNLLRKRLQALPLRFAVATEDDEHLYGSVTSGDIADQINSRLRLPRPLEKGQVKIVDRSSTAEMAEEELEAARKERTGRRFAPMIKTVGWHLVEVRTESGSGDPVTALVEVQVISSSA